MKIQIDKITQTMCILLRNEWCLNEGLADYNAIHSIDLRDFQNWGIYALRNHRKFMKENK